MKRASIAILLLIGLSLPAGANWNSRKTSEFQDRSQLQALITGYAQENIDVDEMAATPSGEWVVVAGQQVTASGGFPSFALGKINQYVNAGARIDVISFAPNGSYVIVAGGFRWFSKSLPRAAELKEAVNGRISAGHEITDIALTATGYSVISGAFAASAGVPSGFYQAVYDRRASGRAIGGVEIGFDGGWAVYGDNFFMSSGVNGTLYNAAQNWMRNQYRMSCLTLGKGTNYVLFGNGTFTPDFSKTMDRVEYGIDDGAQNIHEAMAAANLPGVSLAVIDDNKVVFARGYGTLEAGAQRPVLANSPFDLASLSKYLGALTIMRAIQDPQNGMSLATNLQQVLDQGSQSDALNIWRSFTETYPEAFGIPEATIPADMITLARLLSHSASLAPGASAEFTSWPTSDPSMLSLLLGYECDNGCAYSNTVFYNPNLGLPFSQYSYSGGGFLVAEAMTEKVLNDDFDDIAQDLVLGPLGMSDSTAVQPIPSSFAARAAEHHEEGVPNPRAHYPWKAAGGFYASAADYAKAMIPLMNQGMTADDEPFLHPWLAMSALTDQAAGSRRYGFGVALSASAVTEFSTTSSFAHTGCHLNGARAMMRGYPGLDQGLVVLVNSDDGSCGPATGAFMSDIRRAVGCALGWPPVDSETCVGP